MSITQRLRAAILVFSACAAMVPLRAQGDPRLQSVNTDLLDVYHVSPAKPELLTIFDFSGSMHAIYWQKQYYTGPGQTSHNPGWNNMSYGDDFPGIVPVMDSNGYIRMLEGTGYYQSIYNYTQASQFAKPGTTREAVLVRPDGTTIPLDHTKTYTRADLEGYVKQASHLRVTATASAKVGGSTQTVTRTIDLPIPWAIMDPLATNNNNAFNTIVYVTDPSGGPAVPPDALYQSTSEYNILNRDNGGWKIGRFHYNKDYLWWVFFGTDVRNSTNDGSMDTGKFVIPAVYDSLQEAGSIVEPSKVPEENWIDGSGANVDWPTATYPAASWKNGLPGLARFQALKNSVVHSWFDNQAKVWWAYRFIDDNEDSKSTVNTDNGNASSTAVSRDLRLFRTATSSSTPDQQLSKFLGMEPQTSTPLAHAFANAYAQLALTSDSQSTFGTGSSSAGQDGTENPIPPCRTTFLVAFTDGIANDHGLKTGDPYAAGTRELGNIALGSISSIRPYSANFNIWTLAGVAAQYQPKSKYTGPGKGTFEMDTIAPWWITTRGSTQDSPRQARTMTVAMSVAGSLKDTASGKSDLFRAALYGNSKQTTWNLNTPPFDPKDPASDPDVNPFFFDATDVTKLSEAMTAILEEVTKASAAVAAPSSPLVGLSLGNQVYLGLFQTADGPRWQGDLLMAGLLVSPKGINFLDKSGGVATNINASNAVWSANMNVFNNLSRTWKTRNLYTNLPGTAALVPFDESNGSLTAGMVGATSSTDRTAFIRFMRGAESAAETDDTDVNPRTDILGDIVSSSPAVLEYPLDALTAAVSPKLAGLKGSVPSGATAHFRVIFVGDNQGIFHAFGELSWTETKTVTLTNSDGTPLTDSNGNPVTVQTSVPSPLSDVDELWAFIPGDQLKYIPNLRVKTNPHRYRVDGSPYLYFNDVPASGQVRGDGIVDGSDVVRIIIGERKGGRSYYAFDFSNLANAVANSGNIMAWKLVPDDIPTGTTDAQQKVIARMGFATCTPAVGRVDTSSYGTKDLLFLGGGLSTQSVDKAFEATYGTGTRLGRSILAFDVVNGPGSNLYTWDFTTSSFTNTFGAMGAVSAGVVPFEFFTGSQRTQRVYFADTPTDPNTSTSNPQPPQPRGGGVWALGSNNLASNGVIRLDSSNIDDWTNATAASTQGIRKVLQGATGWSLTSPPTPFLLNGPYPAVRTADPKSYPMAVGVVVGSGDRNDPMDNDGINPAISSGTKSTPYNNWLAVAFDRQDSGSLSGVSGVTTTNIDQYGIQLGTSSTDGDLADLTLVSSFTGSFNGYSVDPANADFYLKKKLGYKLNVGAAQVKDASTFFYPKVITNTVVLNGVLFFSGFTPQNGSTDACSGVGFTNTYRICNVMQPTFNSGSTVASATSFNGGDPGCTGVVLTYPNLPGEITALGSTAIIQSGQGVSTTGASGSIGNTGAQVGGSFGKTSGFGFKPRSWRIVR